MKASITFNLPEEHEEFMSAVKGADYKWAVEEIWQQVFRPCFKHGYNNKVLAELSDRDYEVIEALSELYRQVLNNCNL